MIIKCEKKFHWFNLFEFLNFIEASEVEINNGREPLGDRKIQPK